MVVFNNPKEIDLGLIYKILLQWTERKEADKYLKRVSDEAQGKTKFKMSFWVAKKGDNVLAIGGLADPLPKVLPLTKTATPGEIKILYVGSEYQGRGVGKKLVGFLESQAEEEGRSELMIRSAEKYKGTAWGFYEKLGYVKVGVVSGGKEKKKMQVFSKRLSCD